MLTMYFENATFVVIVSWLSRVTEREPSTSPFRSFQTH